MTLAVSGLLLAGCGGSSSAGAARHPGPPVGSSSPSASASLPSYVVARLDVGSQPCAVEGGYGSVWVSVYGDDKLIRIDSTTHQIVARIKTGTSPCGIAVGGGSVWVENYGSDDVTRVDPQTNRATTVRVGIQPYDVTYAAGAAWVTNYHDDTVTRIDARTGRTQTVKVGGDPVGIAPAAGAVWVTNQADGTISRVDPATLKVRTSDAGDQPAWTSWGGGVLWVANGTQMLEIDPARGQVLRRRDLGATANDGDVVGRTVWVPDSAGNLDAIAADGSLAGRWPLHMTQPFVLAQWAGKLWVVDFKGTAVEAVDPRLLRR